MLQDTDQAGVEAAAWLLGYLATDPANGRPLISLGAAPALVCIPGILYNVQYLDSGIVGA